MAHDFIGKAAPDDIIMTHDFMIAYPQSDDAINISYYFSLCFVSPPDVLVSTRRANILRFYGVSSQFGWLIVPQTKSFTGLYIITPSLCSCRTGDLP